MKITTIFDCPNLGSQILKLKNGQTYREYLLTKIQTFDLMTWYNTELRIKVNRIWERYDNVIRDCDILNKNYNNLSLLKTEQWYYKDFKSRKY
jgi:hypothetical protein